MDQILHLIFTLIAALNAATGAPVDVNHLPDRPPIVAPTVESNSIILATGTPAPTAVLQTTIITGTITTVQSNLIVVSGQSITIAPDAQIKGHLQVGAVVQVNAVVHTDGSVDANTVQVSEDTGTPTQQAQVTESPGVQATETPEATVTNVPGVQPTPPLVQATEPAEIQPTPPPVQATQPPEGQPTVKPTPQPQPTEPPESQPTVKPTPQPQPTEPPESQPTSKPSPQPQPQPTATPGD